MEEDWGNASNDYIQECKRMIANEYNNNNDNNNNDNNEMIQNMFVAVSGFYRFLVESPMKYDGTSSSSSSSSYGPVHQHYRIDGKLMAVGVVDLLPTGISSVYAFYDPSQHVCAFGKIMSLREIDYAFPKYYYLGYYIESCPKMRYKAEYHPSELLCPTTYTWVDAAKAHAILMRDSPEHHCCTLDKNENSNGGNDINGKLQTPTTAEIVNHQLRLDVGASTLVTLDMLQGSGQAVIKPILEEFVKEMGPELSTQFILKLV
jgi:arginine-tRNA-protein transferase